MEPDFKKKANFQEGKQLNSKSRGMFLSEGMFLTFSCERISLIPWTLIPWKWMHG